MDASIAAFEHSADRRRPKGLRQFVNPQQQRAWLEGELSLTDAPERTESLEHRFKYVARFEKLLRRPQAEQVLDILRVYGGTCIPIPRRTERDYWSVSCLPSTSDKPLVRVNASWMELFTLLPDGDRIRARIILHLSDFTTFPSPLGEGDDPGLEPGKAGEDDTSSPSHSASSRGPLPLPRERVDEAFLEQCVERPEDVSHVLWRRPEILIVKVRGSVSIRKFLANPRALRAMRNFNLTHMNRGRNAYQASHCYSVADVMVGD
jgi:hypothetical protein